MPNHKQAVLLHTKLTEKPSVITVRFCSSFALKT
jgi:hypothetical protein